MLYALVCTEGHMRLHEVRDECVAQKWAPLVIYREEGRIKLPVFPTTQTARRFAQRNFPREWLTGALGLNRQDYDIFARKEIICTTFDFPKYMKDRVTFDIEIHEFDYETDVEVQTI